MGTSNLYKGPKKTILLPSDYNPDEIPELSNSPENVPEPVSYTHLRAHET